MSTQGNVGAERIAENKSQRKRFRAELVQDENGSQDFFTLQTRCIRKFGVAAGVFVRQLVFWDGKGVDPEGWIYKTRDELLEEIGLSKRQQDKARKTLTGLKVLEEERRTVAPHHQYCAMHYRVNLEKLVEILQTPHSTLNQWKRGRRYTKDPESGRFDQIPEEVPLGNTDSNLRFSNTDSNLRHSITESEVALSTSESEVALDNIDSDLRLGITNSTTESTSGELLQRTTSESSSEDDFKEFLFQRAADAQKSATPPLQVNNSRVVEEEKDGEEQPAGTTPFPVQPHGVSEKMATQVRWFMEHGVHSPVAVKHYLAGKVGVETVAEYVGWEVTDGDIDATTLIPTVRLFLEEKQRGYRREDKAR